MQASGALRRHAPLILRVHRLVLLQALDVFVAADVDIQVAVLRSLLKELDVSAGDRGGTQASAEEAALNLVGGYEQGACRRTKHLPAGWHIAAHAAVTHPECSRSKQPDTRTFFFDEPTLSSSFNFESITTLAL